MNEQSGQVGNLQYQTNNALLHTFTVNSLNQLDDITCSDTFTVAGVVGHLGLDWPKKKKEKKGFDWNIGLNKGGFKYHFTPKISLSLEARYNGKAASCALSLSLP